MEPVNRRAEQVHSHASQERINNQRIFEAESSRIVVKEFFDLIPPAIANLEHLEYPVPSLHVTHNDELRVAWDLYTVYDVNFHSYLLADGEVVFSGYTYGTQKFDANDLLLPDMQTKLKFHLPSRPNTLIMMNKALKELGNHEIMSNYNGYAYESPVRQGRI